MKKLGMMLAPTQQPLQARPRKRQFLKFQDRLNQVEAALGTGVPEPQIRRQLAALFGVKEAVIGRYIQEVFLRWEEDSRASGSNTREAKRNQMRMQLQTVAHRCLNHKTSAGVADPDYRAAIACYKGLTILDGLNDQPPEFVGPSAVTNITVGLGPFGPQGFKTHDEIRAYTQKAIESGLLHKHISSPKLVPDEPEKSQDDEDGDADTE